MRSGIYSLVCNSRPLGCMNNHTFKLRLFAYVFWAASFFAAPVVYGQSSEVVVVDYKYILSNSNAGQWVSSFALAQRDKFQVLINSWYDTLKQEEDRLLRDQKVLDRVAFQDKLRKFEAYQVKVKQDIEKINNKIALLLNDGREQILSALNEIVQGEAEKRGVTVAFDKSFPIYFAASIDITNIVMAQLNIRMTSVDLKEISWD